MVDKEYKSIIKKYENMRRDWAIQNMTPKEKDEAVKKMFAWRTTGIVGWILCVYLIMLSIGLGYGLNYYYYNYEPDISYEPDIRLDIITSLEKEVCSLNNETHYGGFILKTDKVYNVVCEDKTIHLNYGG